MARLNAVIDRAEPFLATVVPTTFLDDITTKNVMVDGGRLTGIVDCDLLCYGELLLHLGLTAASVHYQFPAECAFYVDELVRLRGLSATESAAVDLYEAVFLAQFLTCARSEPTGAWRQVARTLAHACLDRAEDPSPVERQPVASSSRCRCRAGPSQLRTSATDACARGGSWMM